MADPNPTPQPDPISEDDWGCILAFVPIGPVYQPSAALAVIAALNGKGFTGVCECYLRPQIEEGLYLMALALAPGPEGPELTDSWWGSYVSVMTSACEDDEDIQVHREGSELVRVSDIREDFVHAGTAGFEKGRATWVIDPDNPDPDSPFTYLCRNASW